MLNNKPMYWDFLKKIKKNIDTLYPIQIPDEKNAFNKEMKFLKLQKK